MTTNRMGLEQALSDERISNATLIRLIRWADEHKSHYVAVAMRELLDRRELDKQDPVAWTDAQELRDVEKNGCGYLFTVNPVTPNADPRRVIKLYSTAQPVRVPDEPPEHLLPKGDSRDAAYRRGATIKGWRLCRAAMLKSVTNEP